jgi:hypothetical protein
LETEKNATEYDWPIIFPFIATITKIHHQENYEVWVSSTLDEECANNSRAVRLKRTFT